MWFLITSPIKRNRIFGVFLVYFQDLWKKFWFLFWKTIISIKGRRISIYATTERINVRGYSNTAWNVSISHFIHVWQYAFKKIIYTKVKTVLYNWTTSREWRSGLERSNPSGCSNHSRDKPKSLKQVVKCRASVNICSPSPAMVTSPNAWNSRVGRKTPNKTNKILKNHNDLWTLSF